MFKEEIVKDSHFEEVAEVKLDAKSLITLGKNKNLAKSKIYKVYRNAIGQIILDPQVTIPAHEQWLFKNKKAVNLLQKGLEEAKRGKLVKAPEDYSKYVDA